MPPTHADFAWTAFVLFGVLGVGWGAITFGLLQLAWSLARLQRHDHELIQDRGQALAAGPSHVVHGRVEVDGDAPAIEIDVVQRVTNHASKNACTHDWTETSRRVTSRPFRVVRNDGVMVLVQPDDDVLVVDALSTTYPDDRPMERVRSAVVRVGEKVHVYGGLAEAPGGAYRGGAAFVMQPPRGGRLLVATDALRDRYRDRVRSLCGFGLASALLFCFLHAAYTAPVVAMLVFPTHETATVTDAREWQTRSKNGLTHHYVLTATASDGFRVTGEVPAAAYASVQSARLADKAPTIPILRVGTWERASRLGDEVSVNLAVLYFGFIIATMITVMALMHHQPASALVRPQDRRRVRWKRRVDRDAHVRGPWQAGRSERGLMIEVAPPGLEPGCSREPRILKSAAYTDSAKGPLCAMVLSHAGRVASLTA